MGKYEKAAYCAQISDDAPNIEHPADLIDRIIAFEDGTMEQDDVVDLFQELVDGGLAWQLQGAYGRMAHQLIELGYVHPLTVQ